jgi:hypothetical protein
MADTWQENGYITRAMVWSNDTVCGKGVFMGCDNNLYLYKVEEDTYYLIGSLSAGYNIKRLWVNTNNNNYIYGAAWGEPSDTVKTVTMKIFSSSGGTDITNIADISNVFTGEFCYRDGGRYLIGSDETQVIGQYTTSFKAGENLLLPFNQYIMQVKSIAEDLNVNYATSSTLTGMGFISGGLNPFEDQFNSGYYAFYKTPASQTDFDLRFSLGQKGFIEYMPVWQGVGDYGALVYCTQTESSDVDYITYNVFDLQNASSSTLTTMSNYQINSKTFFPTCGTTDESHNVFYVGGVCWYDTPASAADSRTYIIAVVVTGNNTSSAIELYDSTGEATYKYRTFLDIKHIRSGSAFLYTTFLNRDKFGTSDYYGVAKHPYFIQDSLDSVKYFSSYIIGDCIDSNNNYYFTTSNLLYEYTITAGLSIMGDGSQYVEGESNLSSNLISIPYDELNLIDTERTRTSDIIMGVSAPNFPNETQEIPSIGKYYLWKYDNYLADRIELADFADMSIWDAVTQISQCAIDYSIGFDTDDEGSFFLSNKANSEYTVALDISADAIDKNLISIDKDRGLDEVFNYAEITPNIAKISDISKEYYRAPRTRTSDEDHAISVDDILIDTKAHHNISLKLICARMGNVDEVYTNTTDCALLKWQLYEREIEALILGDIAVSAETITVASTFRGGTAATKTDNIGNTINDIIESAINIGDYITIVEPDTQTEETKRITNIVENVLTIETNGFSFAIKSQTIAIISHPFDLTSTNVSWSDEGITTLSSSLTTSVSTTTIYVTDKRDLSKYLVVKCGTDNTYARITNIGDYESNNSGYTITLNTAVNATDGDTLYAYFSPSKDINGSYSYFDIGGTGIRVKLEPSSTNSNYEMWVGDRITITSEGMVLEESEQSKQTAYNMDSINARGRLEFDSVSNKFIDRNKAKHIVRKVVKDYSDPHYIITTNTLLYPTLRFIDENGNYNRVRLYSKKMFPNYNEVIMYPRSISHNLKQGTTIIVGRDCDSY